MNAPASAAQADRVRRVQELRRSNAAQRHRSKKAYSRKAKHAGKDWN